VRELVEPELSWSGADSLRYLHVARAEGDVYFLVNEGESAIRGELRIRGAQLLELLDPWRGGRYLLGTSPLELELERRQSVLLIVATPGRALSPRPLPGDALSSPSIRWDVEPGDWSRIPGRETFSGTVAYRGELSVPEAVASQAAFLDLGAVGEIAEVELNGVSLGVAAWRPYALPLSGSLRAGPNELAVMVSNSMANAYDGLELPSGLMGPVRLLRGR